MSVFQTPWDALLNLLHTSINFDQLVRIWRCYSSNDLRQRNDTMSNTGRKIENLNYHAVAELSCSYHSPRSIRITVITPWYHWQAGSFAPTSYSATIYSPLHLLVAWSTIAFVDVICPYLWHRLIRSWSVVVGVSPLIYRLVLLRVSCWLW